MQSLHRPLSLQACSLACVFLFITIFVSSCMPGQPSTTALQIHAASSTRVINGDLLTAAAKLDPALQINVTNAGSSTLVQGLADGAPADILITASSASMNQALSQGTVTQPVTLARNHMVMVVPKNNPAQIHSIADISPSDVFVACDLQVPCGEVTHRIMERNGAKIQADSLEHQVADVLGKVASGQADAGWVYSTDAVAAGDKVEIIDLPHAQEFPNEIVGAVTADAPNAEAATHILDLLHTDFGTQWKKHGFER